ncbi:MAG: rod shape-determining protein MreC [Xenococcaceae cyanobacterium MO_188.B29]|nr:rod shape-determining protein MreC [Xenococcaceae cyanobacterium MO_188.B29]
MHRWWDKYGWQTTLTILALFVAWLLKQTQATAIAETYYFLVSPFQSQRQLQLENKLTNARILQLEQRLNELEQQNKQFQELLGYAAQQELSITAPIIGRSAGIWWNQITLGKGRNDGVEKGFIVSGIGGVIGRIIQVTPHTSRVLLISDPNSRVGAVVTRTRHPGFIQGQNSQAVVMRFFTQVADVRVGDTITTSSLSYLYPAGLPIGKVKSVNVDKGPAPEAEIELNVPLALLEWVVIKPFTPKVEVK